MFKELFNKQGISSAQTLIIFTIIILTAVILKITYKNQKVADDSLIATINRISQEHFRLENNNQNLLNNLSLFSDSKSEIILLKDISGGDGFGTAERSYSADKFNFKIITSLVPPPENYFYESWLIRDVPYSLVSLGRMNQDESGNYFLEFSGLDEFQNYSKVAITLEPDDANPQPGTYILEGNFNN